ncbi:hypothetical protein AB5N19_07583 [Seiridium cardinale]|uniref:Uncharacterized protein n=1 Tax=Seiridium cardinale TaxID=138064 RepID=A0ABR2XT55_9PEZI
MLAGLMDLSPHEALASRTLYNTNEGEPVAGKVTNVLVTVLASSLCCSFFFQRYSKVTNWRRLPFIQWLVLGLYADSFIFLLGSAVLQFSFNMSDSFAACEAGTVLCLSAYITTKKASISNGLTNRINDLQGENCIIGVKQEVLVAAVTYDVIVNVYLTMLFLGPLSVSYSFSWRPGSVLLTSGSSRQLSLNNKLRGLALKTFIGACLTLASSIANLVALTAFDGEPAWLCFLTCKSDILFSAVVIHFVTTAEDTSSTPNAPVQPGSPIISSNSNNQPPLSLSNSSRQGIAANKGSTNSIHDIQIERKEIQDNDYRSTKNIHSVDGRLRDSGENIDIYLIRE